jgi:3-methylcrotonyl-CoA carboxylase alpha subunit
VTVSPLGDGRYDVARESGRTIAFGIRLGTDTWIFLDGRVYVIEATGASSGRVRDHDDAALSAPMPATVVAIHVTAGQAVKAGEMLVVLEAMKMELTVTAPHDGTVTAIACRVGELVQPGIPLVELEA